MVGILLNPLKNRRRLVKNSPSAFHSFFHSTTGTSPQQFLLSDTSEMRVFYRISMCA
jgi:hypothetical protein